ncbi:type II toxin-antitoxin system RelE/ParE family toxin [Candidatus Peregrinibacteria bacterium]|jgi:toxin ParE1/3/4|nr:type II toxin-antitoxin system RelE/ParE family toxin [Candidatus Peregrinibacteria bacterium]
MQKRKIIWTQSALLDLKDIVEYIEKDSQFSANKVALTIINLVKILEDFPFSGRVIPEFKEENKREIFSFKFRIFYIIHDDIIYIARIISMSQNIDGTFLDS